MIFAKLSTAITIPFGPVLDSTGAEFTTLVVGEVKISKNNGTPAALNASATLTHKEVGIYELVLTTSDISAVGQATLTCSKTTYVAPPVHLTVLPANVYDSLVGGTDNLQIDVVQLLGTAWLTPATAGTPDVNTKLAGGTAWASGAITSAVFGTGAITATAIAADAIGASELAADAVAEIADAVWDEARAGHTTGGSFGEGVASVQGNVTGSVGSVTGAVGSVTGNIGGNLSGTLTSTERNAIADALLNRDLSAVTVTNSRSPINGYRFLRNKWTVSGGTLTVFAEDDTTTAWTATISSDAAADPIVGSDPA